MRHRATITVNADFYGKQHEWSDSCDYEWGDQVDPRWLAFMERVWNEAKLAREQEANRHAAEQQAITDAAALQAARAAIQERRRLRDRRLIPARLRALVK